MRHVDAPGVAAIDSIRNERQDGADDPGNGPGNTVAFEAAETRADDMRQTIESWLNELGELVNEARASDTFRAWLDVQSRFHDYSYRNTLLITHQHPSATRVAGYQTWQEEFDRQVMAGEQAIWIWAPIIAKRCPECERSRRYHEAGDCDYDDSPPEEWSKGVVAFKPVPVFDISQTEGEPLPELETAAAGDGTDLLERLLDAADALGVEVRIVPDEEWSHGHADGVCKPPNPTTGQPFIEVRERPAEAAVAGTLIHELAHARLHLHVEDPDERRKREVEAEAVAYVVGRYFGLDTTNSAFYLAAWQGEDERVLGERLGRISRAAKELIEGVARGS